MKININERETIDLFDIDKRVTRPAIWADLKAHPIKITNSIVEMRARYKKSYAKRATQKAALNFVVFISAIIITIALISTVISCASKPSAPTPTPIPIQTPAPASEKQCHSTSWLGCIGVKHGR